MSAVLWLARHWRTTLFVAVVAALSALLLAKSQQLATARSELAAERASHALFVERVRAVAAESANQFNVEARQVETLQARITQEVSRDYQARLADLRRRLDARRLLPAAGPQRPGPAGDAGLPPVSRTAGGPDATAGDPGLSERKRAIATEQALRLEALQEWVRRQALGEGVDGEARMRNEATPLFLSAKAPGMSSNYAGERPPASKERAMKKSAKPPSRLAELLDKAARERGDKLVVVEPVRPVVLPFVKRDQ